MRVGFIAVTMCCALQVFAVAPSSPPIEWDSAPIEFEPWRSVEDTGKATIFATQFPSRILTGRAANDTVHLTIMRPNGVVKAPVVVLLHYWGAPDLRPELAQAERLAKRGIATVMMELPYHLQRTPIGTRSGELAVVPDPVRLRQTMVQAVADVRRTIDWIESRPEFDASRIGLAGTSLGALIGSTVFGVDRRVSSFCSILGGADLAGIVWRSARLVRERDALRRSGITRESLAAALKDIEPLTYLDPEETRPAFMIGARYDTVVPRSNQEALMNRMPNGSVLWLPTGHYGGFLVQQSIAREVSDFFFATFGGLAYNPPSRLYAPTLRLIGLANPVSGLSVGAGIDLWNLDADGRVFGTLIFTPKGLQGFVGGRVSTGLALGVNVLPRQTTVGVLWSFVL